MYYQPTPISWNNYHFLIMSAPDDSSMKRCIKVSYLNANKLKDLENYNVKHLARSCEKTYDEELLNAAGIKVTELMFPDGMLPEQSIIDQWLKIVDDFFENNQAPAETDTLETKPTGKEGGRRHHKDQKGEPSPPRIGVHCVAGLGRAPLLVALALVHKGCSRINAIELIRKNRPGSLNLIQANYLVEYKDKGSKGGKNKNASCQCNIF